jgi:hypothetical protein
MAKQYKTYAQTYLKVAFIFGCHLLLLVMILSGIYGLERLMHNFWTDSEPLFFDCVPIKYPFQFVDIVLILLFGYRAAYEINELLQG